MLNKQLEQYVSRTFGTSNTSQIRRILLRTDSKDIESARIKLNEAILVKTETDLERVYRVDPSGDCKLICVNGNFILLPNRICLDT